ncbi:MAG: methyltransferase domain-containing protein [Syntrophomonadaceae bacterium]
MDTIEINKRYSQLAEESCCLSCGGALDLSQPKEGEVCVDLGCGRGTDVLRLAQTVGEKGFAYGIDISDGMLEKAAKNAEKLGIMNARFIKSELEKLDLESNIGDLVISNCTINHAHDKSAVWNEIYRVLKKGGRFVISDIYSIEAVPEEYRTDPAAVAECWAGAVPKEEYLAVVTQAGFTGVEILEESRPYEKGKIQVVSFTLAGKKPSCCCSCS